MPWLPQGMTCGRQRGSAFLLPPPIFFFRFWFLFFLFANEFFSIAHLLGDPGEMTQKEDPGRGARALLLGKLGCGAAGRAGPTMGPQRLLLPLCSPGLRPRRCQRGDSGCASRKRPVRPAR